MLPFYSHTYFSHLLNHLTVFHLCNFVIARMFYKWNSTVCNLLELALFSPHSSLEIYPSLFLFTTE